MAKTERKFYGTGRRKSSSARVTLVPGTGKITIWNSLTLNINSLLSIFLMLKLCFSLKHCYKCKSLFLSALTETPPLYNYL